MRVTAPAKLNLFLHITGKRADGYHLLDSLVVFTEFGDVLEIEESGALTLQVAGPFAEGLASSSLQRQESKDNLVLRAAHALKGDHHKNARILLHKHIPIGAGLGGGSSDAAAALTALAHLWRWPLEDYRFEELARGLGSDVPVCLWPQTSWMSGVGDEVTPVALDFDLWVLLVNPGVPLLTADVFRHYPGGFDIPLAVPAEFSTAEALLAFLRETRNALEASAIGLLPVIGESLEMLRATPGCLLSRMSGSGATCFGLYEGCSAAEEAAGRIQAQHPQWWCKVTRIQHG